MGNKILKGILFVCLLGLILGISCKKRPDEKTILSDKTKLPETNPNLQEVIVNGDTLRFIYKPGTTKPEYKPGDIVVGQTGEGYLKKVIASATRGDTLIIVSEQACLTEAIQQCDVETTFYLVPQQMRMGGIKRDTTITDKDGIRYRLLMQADDLIVEPMPNGIDFQIKLPNIRVEIRNESGNLAASLTCDTVILTKRIDIDIGIQISWFKVKEFHCIASTADGIEFKNIQVELERSIAKEVENLLTSIYLGTVVIWIGPVPVVFVFSFDVYAGTEATLALSASCNISSQVNLNATTSLGARYTDGDWSPVNEWTLSGNAYFSTNPGASITASLEGFIKGSLTSKLYGVAGPYLFLKPYEYNELSFPPFDFRLGVGLGAGLGFKVEILSWELADYNMTFADFRKELLHSTNPSNHPPNIPQTPSGPASGEVNVSYDFSTSTTDPEGDSVAYQFDWGDGNLSDWSSFVPSGTSVTMSKSWSDSGTFYVKARAKDKEGGTSGWSDGHRFISGGGGYPDTVVATIPVGRYPFGIAALPNGNYVYVANSGSDTVSVIRTSDNTVVATVPVGDMPWSVAALPNGNYVYVTNSYSDNVSVIRTSDNTVVATVPVGDYPIGIAALPNGAFVYVANDNSNNVSVIRTSDNTVVATIPVGGLPHGIAALPNGNYVYVTNRYRDNVSVIRTSDNTVVATVPVGNYPLGIAVLPNGNYVYVTNQGDNTVSVIRTSDNTVVATVRVGDGPDGVAALPDGNYVYVTEPPCDSVSVIRTSDNMVVAKVTVEYEPWGVAALPNGSYVYVTNHLSNSVSVIGRR